MIGLPKLKFTKDKPCDACQKEKQSKSSFKLKNVDDALNDEFWVLTMQEELNQFERTKFELWFLD